ncbi:DM9 repeat-containing protein [Candidatus Methylocalor cossyra]|uniref:Uncharacterized protein n=1 Tax=Candidatus Methylocalor cossyra TaxID=3108543 RepID=A0ABP1C9M1_9GAMM
MELRNLFAIKSGVPFNRWAALAGLGLVLSGPAAADDGRILGGVDVDGVPLYVCVARHGDGSHQPGKLRGDKCFYGWGGREYATSDYTIITPPSGYKWAWVGYPAIPKINDACVVAPPANPWYGSIGYYPGGVDSDGSRLEVCVTHAPPEGDHKATPGKLRRNQCHISWGGKEYIKYPYKVLMFSQTCGCEQTVNGEYLTCDPRL